MEQNEKVKYVFMHDEKNRALRLHTDQSQFSRGLGEDQLCPGMFRNMADTY